MTDSSDFGLPLAKKHHQPMRPVGHTGWCVYPPWICIVGSRPCDPRKVLIPDARRIIDQKVPRTTGRIVRIGNLGPLRTMRRILLLVRAVIHTLPPTGGQMSPAARITATPTASIAATLATRRVGSRIDVLPIHSS